MRSALLIGFVFVVLSSVTAQVSPDLSRYSDIEVRRLVVNSPVLLSASETARVTREIRKLGNPQSPADRERVVDLAEELVREAYQNDGYFNARVRAALTVAKSTGRLGSSDLVVTVIAGVQYRLGAFYWKGMTRFTAEQLSALMPAHAGEIFCRQKVAKGLSNIQTLYSNSGFINFTIIPTPEFDDSQTVSFTMDIDEGGLFTLRSVILSGFTREQLDSVETSLKSLRGQPYTPESRNQVHAIVAKIAPCRDGQFSRHMDDYSHTVDMVFDYSGCFDSWLETLDRVPEQTN